jgi:hypothetical protein
MLPWADVEGFGMVPDVEAPDGSGLAMVGLGVSGIVSEVDRVGEECGELLEDDAVWGEELVALE